MTQAVEKSERHSWKDRVASHAIPFLPLLRMLVRYGPPGVRTSVWNRIGRTRLMSLHRRFTIETDHGRFTGDTADMLSQYVYFFGQWEPEVSQMIRQRLSPGQTFVDIGANTGWYTLLGAKMVAQEGRVVAIEASPANFSWLKENVENNRLENVRLINEAVWSSETFLPLFQGPSSHSGVTTVMPSFAQRRGCEPMGRIRARPLPELLSQDEVETMRVLKIDVEGAEMEVLNGLESMLDRVSPNLEIFLELNPAEYNVIDALRPLRRRGFRAWTIPNVYESDYYLRTSTRTARAAIEELTGTPDGQVDVLLSRTGP